MAYHIRVGCRAQLTNAQRRALRAAIERHAALLEAELMLVDDLFQIEPTIMVRDTPGNRKHYPKAKPVERLVLPWIDPDYVEPEETP